MRDNNQKVDANNNHGKIFANTYDYSATNITYNQTEAKFSDFPLKDYDPKKDIVPTKIEELVESIKFGKRFFILGGNGYDKDKLAIRTAWEISNYISGVSKTVKRWVNSANPQDFDFHLKPADTATIFILRDLTPENTNNNLGRLYKAIQSCKHYLIITTDTLKKKWYLDDKLEELFWEPDSTAELYRLPDLQNFMARELNANKQRLPGELRGRRFDKEDMLLGNLSVSGAAQKLKSLDSIQTFVQRLTTIKKDSANPLIGDQIPIITETDLLKIIENCHDGKLRLRHWYNISLSSSEKLIALGLCLFDGFYDDQFFAAMEKLVEHSWHKREPSLIGLDYCDLESVKHYYRLAPPNWDGIKNVISPHPGLRKIFLENIWDSHRRQILSALPVMETLVKNSVNPGYGSGELYEGRERCNVLRDKISQSLCIIGLKPEHSIAGTILESTLINLASEKDIRVQTVVARAIAQWRDYGQNKKLLETIERWQANATLWDNLKTLLENDDIDPHDRVTPEVYVKATITLTVGFAANYDLPNQMDAKLCELLEELAEDANNNMFIRERFSQYTLPKVVRLHTKQLREIMKEMTKKAFLNEAIGRSLASAYEINPMDVKETLDAWFDECKKNSPTHFSHHELTHREKTLATVAIAYGGIDYYRMTGPITIQDGFSRLKTMLSKEKSSYVREAVLYAMMCQVARNFEKADEYIQALFEVMYKSEIDEFIKRLAQYHLILRKQSKEGDASFEWDEKKFNIWVYREQPLTEVETIIEKWMKNSDKQITLQIALRFNFTLAIVGFRQAEELSISWLKKENEYQHQQYEKNKQTNSDPIFDKIKNREPFLTLPVSWISTLKQKENFSIVRGLLPLLLKHNKANRNTLDFVMKRMHRSTDDRIIQIVDQLGVALTIMRMRKIFVPLFILLVIVAKYLLFQ